MFLSTLIYVCAYSTSFNLIYKIKKCYASNRLSSLKLVYQSNLNQILSRIVENKENILLCCSFCCSFYVDGVNKHHKIALNQI